MLLVVFELPIYMHLVIMKFPYIFIDPFNISTRSFMRADMHKSFFYENFDIYPTHPYLIFISQVI